MFANAADIGTAALAALPGQRGQGVHRRTLAPACCRAFARTVRGTGTRRRRPGCNGARPMGLQGLRSVHPKAACQGALTHCAREQALMPKRRQPAGRYNASLLRAEHDVSASPTPSRVDTPRAALRSNYVGVDWQTILGSQEPSCAAHRLHFLRRVVHSHRNHVPRHCSV